jgi:hypothetical protein
MIYMSGIYVFSCRLSREAADSRARIMLDQPSALPSNAAKDMGCTHTPGILLDQLTAAYSAMSSSFGVEVAAAATLIIHLANEEIGENRAKNQYASHHNYGDDGVSN